MHIAKKKIVGGGKSFHTLHTTTWKSQSCPVSFLLSPQGAHNWRICLTGISKHFLLWLFFCFRVIWLSPLQLFFGQLFFFFSTKRDLGCDFVVSFPSLSSCVFCFIFSAELRVLTVWLHFSDYFGGFAFAEASAQKLSPIL